MNFHPFLQIMAACLLIPGLLLLSAQGQDEAEAKERLKLMQAAVDSMEPESTELKPKTTLAAVPTPLLRYNDPTRGGIKVESANNFLLDAGVWRLGTEGRPTALVTIEIYQAPDGRACSPSSSCRSPTRSSRSSTRRRRSAGTPRPRGSR